MKKHSSLTAVAIALMSAGLQAAPVGPEDWSSVRLYGHGMELGDFSSGQYSVIRNHYYVVTVEKNHGSWIWGRPCTDHSTTVAAETIGSGTKTLFYWNSTHAYSAVHESVAAVQEEHPEWIVPSDQSAAGQVYDLSYAGCRDWWVDHATDQVNNSALAGVFVDAIPRAEAIGQIDYVKSMMSQLPGLVIYNGFRVVGDASPTMQGGHDVLPYADGCFTENFLYGVCDTKEEQRYLIQEMLKIDSDKYIIANAWNPDYKYTLAGFLIIANEYSFYHDASNNDVVVWRPEFGYELGAPRGPAVQVSDWVFTRTFENCVVTIDVENKTETMVWGPTSSVVHIRKRNALAYAIDGNWDGANGQNVYLYSYNANNENQQWEEIPRGDGFYSYQKVGTTFSLDGGNSGAVNQNVYLWTTDADNFNQQWKKVDVGDGCYQLQKRNALDYAIDGGSSGANKQNVKLWRSSSASQNLHWSIE